MARIVQLPIKIEFPKERVSMDDLVNRFRFHKANEVTGEQHARVRNKCFELACELSDLLPEGREKSLAITKLEEVMFWANASIARGGAREARDE